MLYLLPYWFREWLTGHGLDSVVRLLTWYPEFRALLSVVLSFALVLLLGPRVIRWLMWKKIGDRPEFYNARLNELTQAKSNTPTMGGLLIAGAILGCTLLLADLTNFYVHMAILCLLWLAVLGGVDDWLKLTGSRQPGNRREGLFFWEKLVFQLGLAVLLGLFIHYHGVSKFSAGVDPYHFSDMSHALTLPLLKTWQKLPGGAGAPIWVPADSLIVLPAWAFVILSILVIAGSSNAVNLTDGMDGLASGIMSIVAFAFLILTLIAGDVNRATYLLVPYIPLSGELSIVAGAMVGSCLGFLWYNANPARVFMGDTGSLPLGGLLGYIAVVIRQEFLLLIIGGVFVIEALSVMAQVGYFRLSGGRRIFKCSPIHYHFHLSGWTENQVVVRFWIISVILAACALATIKLR